MVGTPRNILSGLEMNLSWPTPRHFYEEQSRYMNFLWLWQWLPSVVSRLYNAPLASCLGEQPWSTDSWVSLILPQHGHVLLVILSIWCLFFPVGSSQPWIALLVRSLLTRGNLPYAMPMAWKSIVSHILSFHHCLLDSWRYCRSFVPVILKRILLLSDTL